MAIWPFRKRSKTNSGGKRPTHAVNDESRHDPDLNARPQTPSSVRSNNGKSKRRNDTLRSIRRAASQRKNKSKAPPQTPSGPGPSNVRDVTMSSPSPPQTSVAQLHTPRHTPPPSQPSYHYTPTALDNRRSDSSASSHRPRKRNQLRKAQTFDDGRNSQLTAGYPSPPPDKDPPQLFRSFSKRGENNIFRPFSRKDKFDRPLSEMSMRTQESLHSMVSFESRTSPLRAFKVRSLDVLSPRPTLRLSSNPYVGSTGANGKMPDYPSNHERKTSKSRWRKDRQSPIVEESPKLKGTRVYGLADELDSRGIREALERDARRRSRKQKEDEAKAQAKLERRAEKQKAEEYQAAHPESSHILQQDVRDPIQSRSHISREAAPGTPVKVDASSSVHSPPTGTQTPMSWLHGPSQENLSYPEQAPLEPPPPRRRSTDGNSFKSEVEDPIVETATAVRLSGYSAAASPPPSPTMQLRTPKLVNHSPTHSRKMSRDLLENLPDAEEETEENRALANAWTSFFRKATAARVQKEHEAQEEALCEQNDTAGSRAQSGISDEPRNPRESISMANGRSGIQGTFLQSPTPRSAGSRVPTVSDFLPESPPTPRQSQPSIPVPQQYINEDTTSEPVRRVPLSPSRISPASPLSRNFSDARKPSRLPKDIPDRYVHHASHLSDVSSRASASHERIKSMASIDSEGSWLSGRLNSRQSTHRIPSLRDSAASLKLQYNEVKGYEDRRASVADDQYFSGVQDGGSSDDEERDILDSYLDDDASAPRSSITSPPTAYRSPPRSPTIEIPTDNDSDTDLSKDQYLWREGLGRRPTITRVDSNFVRKREEMGSLYDASSMETADYNHVPMAGELVMEDAEGNMVVPDRARNSPSPTLGKTSPRFLTPNEFNSPHDPFSLSNNKNEDATPRASQY